VWSTSHNPWLPSRDIEEPPALPSATPHISPPLPHLTSPHLPRPYTPSAYHSSSPHTHRRLTNGLAATCRLPASTPPLSPPLHLHPWISLLPRFLFPCPHQFGAGRCWSDQSAPRLDDKAGRFVTAHHPNSPTLMLLSSSFLLAAPFSLQQASSVSACHTRDDMMTVAAIQHKVTQKYPRQE
jgi:hypothetical protein